MLYIVLAYLMLIAALSIAVCLYYAFLFIFFLQLILQMLLVFMHCLVLLTHSFFISSIILHHAQCFKYVVFSLFYLHTILLTKGLCALWRIALNIKDYYYYVQRLSRMENSVTKCGLT